MFYVEHGTSTGWRKKDGDGNLKSATASFPPLGRVGLANVQQSSCLCSAFLGAPRQISLGVARRI